jgi:hypothetical protein
MKKQNVNYDWSEDNQCKRNRDSGQQEHATDELAEEDQSNHVTGSGECSEEVDRGLRRLLHWDKMQEAVKPEDRKNQAEQNADYRGNRFHQSSLSSRSLLTRRCDGIAKLSRAYYSTQAVFGLKTLAHLKPREPGRVSRVQIHPSPSISLYIFPTFWRRQKLRSKCGILSVGSAPERAGLTPDSPDSAGILSVQDKNGSLPQPE